MSALASQLPVEGRRLRSDGAATRARMLEAVVTCIVENGYYEASSNAIARHAGVTWGAIQHQFGTRQGLLLAVLEDRWRRLTDRITAAAVSGDTLEQRLACVMAALEAHYGSPEHLVVTQIMLDLIQSPATSEATKRAVEEHGRELTRVWRPLFSKALGDAAKDEDLVRYAFLTIRGYLSAGTMAARLAPRRPDAAIRTLLLRGVACAIRERAAEAGLGTGDPALRRDAGTHAISGDAQGRGGHAGSRPARLTAAPRSRSRPRWREALFELTDEQDALPRGDRGRPTPRRSALAVRSDCSAGWRLGRVAVMAGAARVTQAWVHAGRQSGVLGDAPEQGDELMAFGFGEGGEQLRFVLVGRLLRLGEQVARGSPSEDPHHPGRFNTEQARTYQFHTAQSLRPSWDTTIPTPDPDDWRDPQILAAYVKAALASDPTADDRTPPSFRAPSGAMEDSFLLATGHQLYDASTITGRVLIIRSERDFWSRPQDAARLERDLHHAASVRHVTIPDATHYVHLDRPEAGRTQFLTELLTFLAD